jgi:hypothetical protein
MRLARHIAPAAALGVLGCGAVLVLTIPLSAAAEKSEAAAKTPPAPKVSTFAPADDLVRQVDLYIESLKEIVSSEENYKDDKDKFARQSNTLVVVALALGLHDEDNKYKAAAGALMKAAQAVAAAKDYTAARKSVAVLAAATTAKIDAPLRWEKVAALPELMNQVPAVHTKLKLLTQGANFKKRAKDAAGHVAVIAVIAQGTLSDASAAKNAEQVRQWQKFSAAMRDGAATVGAAIRNADQKALAPAMQKLNQSCEDCHTVFHPTLVNPVNPGQPVNPVQPVQQRAATRPPNR